MKNKKKFTFGVWLELPSTCNLEGEGIIRLLTYILTADRISSVKVVIACAKWTRPQLKKLLHDSGIETDRFEIISGSTRLPIALRIHRWLRERPKLPRPKWKIRVVRWLVNTISKSPIASFFLSALLGTESYFILGVLTFLTTILFLLAFPVLIVLWLLGTILGLLRKAFEKITGICKKRIASPIAKVTGFNYGQFVSFFYQHVEEKELRRLLRKAVRRKDVAVWFVPHPGYKKAIRLKGPVVVAVPDLVYVEFPIAFANVYGTENTKQLDAEIRELVDQSTRVISYSEYIRSKHVISQLNVSADRTKVIPHAPMNVGKNLSDSVRQYGGDVRAAANATIHSYMRKKYVNPKGIVFIPQRYFENYPWEEVEFLFVSAQIRPHKNYLNLIRAHEKVLRRYNGGQKLVITGNIAHDNSGLLDFIQKQRLELDVISIPQMPGDVHAAFYQLAALTVVPTLFEGGFPFPFTESLSVGTPVVMSSIPVTRNILPKNLEDIMLFNPYDVQDMVDRILWGLTHRRELLDKQLPFYKKLCKRTWHDVANDYLDVFREAANRGRETS